MAQEKISELIVSLGIDSSQFEQGIKNVNKATSAMEKSFNNSKKALELSEKGFSDYERTIKAGQQVIEQYVKKMDALSTKYKEQEQKLKSYVQQKKELPTAIEKADNKLKEIESTLGKTSQEYKEQDNELKQLKQQYNNIDGSIDKAINSLRSIENQMETLENRTQSVTKEVKELNTAMNNINAEKLKKAGESISSTGENITSAGQSLLPVTAGIVGIGVSAINAGIEFESSMSNVQAISGATGDELQSLEEKAKALGRSTSFSSSQISDAFGYMALSGYDTVTMLESIEPMLNLAKAGNLDLATASDLVTDSMSALGKETDELDTYLNQVAKTATMTNTNVDSLMDAFIQTGGMAKTLGINTSELSASLGILANAGYKGSEAGRAMSTVLTRLAKPPKECAKSLEELNISVFDAEGNFVGLENVLGQLNKAYSGLSAEEQAYHSKNIAGQNYLSQFIELVDKSGGTLQEYTKTIGNSNGALQEMSDIMGDNLKGRIDGMKSAIEGSLLVVFDAILPVVEEIVNKFTEWCNWFTNLSEDTQEFIIKAGLFVGALAPVLLIVGNITTKFGGLITKLGELAIKFGGLGTTAGGTGTVLAELGSFALPALVVALVGIATAIGDNENALLSMQEKWGSFGTILSGICEFISGVVQITFGTILSYVELAMDGIAAIMDGAGGKTIEDAWSNHQERINNITEQGASKILLTSTRGMSQLLELTQGELNNINSIFDTLTSQISNIIGGNYSSASQTLASQLSGMSQSQIIALTGLNDETKILFNNIKDSMSVEEKIATLNANFETMASCGKLNAETLETSISGAMETVSSQMDIKTQSGANAVKSNLNSATNAIESATSNMSSSASTGMSEVANSFMTSSGTIPKDVQSNMDKSVQAIKQAGSDMYNGVRTSFSKMESVCKQHATSMYLGVQQSAQKMAQSAKQSASDMYNGVTTSSSKMRDKVIADWNSIRNTLSKGITGKVSVTKFISTVSSGESKMVSPALAMANESIARLNTDNLNYRASSYQATPIVSTATRKSQQLNNHTINELKKQNKLLTEMLSVLVSERTTVVENTINLDGKAVARGTAKYINSEINSINRKSNRLAGIY